MEGWSLGLLEAAARSESEQKPGGPATSLEASPGSRAITLNIVYYHGSILAFRCLLVCLLVSRALLFLFLHVYLKIFQECRETEDIGYTFVGKAFEMKSRVPNGTVARG